MRLHFIPVIMCVMFFNNILNATQNPPRATMNVVFSNNNNVNYYSESCGNTSGHIILTLQQPLVEDTRFIISWSGSAVKDIDYTSTLSDTITFPANITTQSFDIQIISDGISDNNEEITVSITEESTNEVVATQSIEIFDEMNLSINNEDIVACLGKPVSLSATGAMSYEWTPINHFVDNKLADVVYTGNGGEIVVIGQLNNCIALDTINIDLQNSSISIEHDDVNECGPVTLQLNTVVSAPGGTYEWFPNELFENPMLENQTVTLGISTDIIVKYSIGDCISYDTLKVKIAPGTFFFPNFSDTTICYGQSVSFGDLSLAKNYSFDPLTYLDFTDINNPVATPTEDITYKLTITSSDNTCTKDYEFKVDVAPGRFELVTPEYVELCLGDSTTISYSYNPKNNNVTWVSNDTNIIQINDTTFRVKPTVTTEYVGTYVVGNCTFTKKVIVRVDSLPDIPLNLFWPKDYYCQGEIVAISSPTIDYNKYPDIKFNWGQPLGGSEPFDKANLAIVTQDTFTYVRVTTNRACKQNDSITLNVVVPYVEFTLNDTTVCSNAPVPVTIVTDMEEVEWEPEDYVNCKDCKSVIITTPTSQTISVTGKVDGCPAGASIHVNIHQPFINLSVNDTTVCPNEPVLVTLTTDATNLSWSPKENISCTDCNSATISVTTGTKYTVTGVVLDGYNCVGSGDLQINMAAHENFQITLDPSDTVAIGNKVVATVEDAAPGSQYHWKLNGKSLGNHGPEITFVAETEFDLIEAEKLSLPGDYCIGSGFNNITGIKPYLDMPNAFTPNNDQKNDIFKPVVPDGVNVLEFIIVNRWGQTVFSETNSSKGWDGKFKNKDAPRDTYLYKVKFQLAEGGIIEEKRGEVNLIR